MKTISINLYKFDELSETAKQKALSDLSNINVDYEWWESTYDDAERIGLKITSFELDGSKNATGEFINSGLDVAESIIKEHGHDCETRKTALNYIDKYNSLMFNVKSEDDEMENEFEEIEKEFLNSLLEDYANILQRESEYLQSEEAIIETIKANDYDFTEDGKLY